MSWVRTSELVASSAEAEPARDAAVWAGFAAAALNSLLVTSRNAFNDAYDKLAAAYAAEQGDALYAEYEKRFGKEGK